jgi:hypothetical protein
LHEPRQRHQKKWNGRFKGCVVIFGNRRDPFQIPDTGFWIRKLYQVSPAWTIQRQFESTVRH